MTTQPHQRRRPGRPVVNPILVPPAVRPRGGRTYRRALPLETIRAVWALVTADSAAVQRGERDRLMGIREISAELGIAMGVVSHALATLRAAGHIRYQDRRPGTRVVVVGFADTRG